MNLIVFVSVCVHAHNQRAVLYAPPAHPADVQNPRNTLLAGPTVSTQDSTSWPARSSSTEAAREVMRCSLKGDGCTCLASARHQGARWPRILHQSWRDRQLPSVLRGLAARWRAVLPDGWEYRMWTDQDNRALWQQHIPHMLPVYDRCTLQSYRVLARSCVSTEVLICLRVLPGPRRSPTLPQTRTPSKGRMRRGCSTLRCMVESTPTWTSPHVMSPCAQCCSCGRLSSSCETPAVAPTRGRQSNMYPTL